jgi:hypothetical protein
MRSLLILPCVACMVNTLCAECVSLTYFVLFALYRSTEQPFDWSPTYILLRAGMDLAGISRVVDQKSPIVGNEI